MGQQGTQLNILHEDMDHDDMDVGSWPLQAPLEAVCPIVVSQPLTQGTKGVPMPIYLRSPEGELLPMDEQPYASEDLLQALIASNPELLGGDHQSSERWLLVSREMATPGDQSLAGRWSLDHLFVDAFGIPTLVEVKRSSDTRIRREVVGQLLDYAANAVVYWPQGRLADAFGETCTHELQRDPEKVLSEFLDEDQDPTDFWRTVEANLRAGRLRLIFLADSIPSELQRVVEFLNEQMNRTEVLAVEVRQYVSADGHQTLVPRTIGHTAAAEATKRPKATRRWTEQEYLDAIEASGGPGYRQTAREYIAWGVANGGIAEWGSGTTRGSLQFRWMVDDHPVRPLALLTTGGLYISFAGLAKASPFVEREQRQAYAEMLNQIDGVSVPPDGVDRWPEVSTDTLGDEQVRRQFLRALDWFLRAMGRTPTSERVE